MSNLRAQRRSPSGAQDILSSQSTLHQPLSSPGSPQARVWPTSVNAPDITSVTLRSSAYYTFPLDSHPLVPKQESTTPPTPKDRGSRARSSSSEFGTFQNTKFLFTPASTPVPSSPPKSPPKKAASSPLFRSRTPPHDSKPFYPYRKSFFPPRMHVDSEDDCEDDSVIFTSWHESTGHTKTSANLRARVYSASSVTGLSRGRDKPAKCITTTPGHYGAGETETEIDEPPRHLPTSRIIPSSGPLIPPNTLQQRLTPLLFEFSRLLSIVPAIFGTLYNLYHVYRTPVFDTLSSVYSGSPPQPIDFLVSALWAILTGYQCLRLTTGLLTRWRLYYPPLPTLIRLLALQAICWPATHLTLTIFEHEKRPVIVWAIVGTTTCMSRSVQIWVTSNLWWETNPGGTVVGGGAGSDVGKEGEEKGGYWKRWGGGKWGGRRWDWTEVGIKCVLPAGVVYCVMAWAQVLRREWGGC